MHGNSQVARINGAAAAADAWAPQDAAESLLLLDKIDAKYSYSSVTNGANGATNGASAPAAPACGGHHHAYVTRKQGRQRAERPLGRRGAPPHQGVSGEASGEGFRWFFTDILRSLRTSNHDAP